MIQAASSQRKHISAILQRTTTVRHRFQSWCTPPFYSPTALLRALKIFSHVNVVRYVHAKGPVLAVIQDPPPCGEQAGTRCGCKRSTARS